MLSSLDKIAVGHNPARFGIPESMSTLLSVARRIIFAESLHVLFFPNPFMMICVLFPHCGKREGVEENIVRAEENIAIPWGQVEVFMFYPKFSKHMKRHLVPVLPQLVQLGEQQIQFLQVGLTPGSFLSSLLSSSSSSGFGWHFERRGGLVVEVAR
jgi:hypothetical protein